MVFSNLGQSIFLIVTFIFYVALVLDRNLTSREVLQKYPTNVDNFAIKPMLFFYSLYTIFCFTVAIWYYNGIVLLIALPFVIFALKRSRYCLERNSITNPSFTFFGLALLNYSPKVSFLLLASGLYALSTWLSIAIKNPVVPTWSEWLFCAILVQPPIVSGMNRLLIHFGYLHE